MSFTEQMQDVLMDEFNVSVTENGAYGYSTTGKALLDLNFAVSSLRNEEPEEILRLFIKAYYEEPMLALRWLFFAGDIRQGLGERRLFKIIIGYLAETHRDIAGRLMKLIPEYSRWDVVVMMLETPLAEETAAMIDMQLKEDMANMAQEKPVSLCAKWLPSENASDTRMRDMAGKLSRYLSMTRREYRQTLSALRKYLDVIEVKMSLGKWAEINYAAVPSKANIKYRQAFWRNDKKRRMEYLEAVEMGEEKIRAGVLYPHDIVASYFGGYGLREKDAALEELWKALPDYVQGNGTTLCVADGSGSMMSGVGNTGATCLDVANALAIYFAQHCRGEFHNRYITFSNRPKFVDLSKAPTLHDKLELALAHNEVANTNIEAVFELILTTAVKFHMAQEELPANLLILSDMEFDEAACQYVDGKLQRPDAKLFDNIKQRYARHGYRLPRLVFWNICSRTGTVPVTENKLGVALVSGFSPVVVKMVLGSEVDPYKMLTAQLLEARYDAVEEAVREAS